MALLGTGYFICAWAGRFLSGDGGTLVSYWLPGGLFVAVLLLNDTRDWPWLMLSIVPANVLFDWLHDPRPNAAVILLFCAANIIQAGCGAWLVRRFVADKPVMASLKEFFGLLFFSGVLGSAIGATIATTMVAGFHQGSRPFPVAWMVVWGGDIMSVLVLAPLILVCFGARSKLPPGFFTVPKTLEAMLVYGGLGILSWHFFVQGGGVNSPKAPLLGLVLWAGLRFGLRGGTLAVFFLAVWSAFLTTHYLQALSASEISSGRYVFTLQIFVAVAAVVGIVPAIVLGERDRTLAQLRESEARFRTLNEASFEGVFISENGVILDANDQGLKMFGCERREMTGKRILDLVAPASKSVVAEAVRNDQEGIYGHELLRKDGSSFFAEARARVVWIEGRKFRMTALRDVTARQRTEQALRESEEKFSKAFRASPDGLSISEEDTGRFIEVNEGYCRLYGYSRDEMLGRTSVELGIWESAQDREGFLQQLKKSGTVRDLEIRTRTRNGALKIIHLSAEPIELEGKSCLVSVLHDVTDRIQAEEASRCQRQILEMIASGQPMKETLDALLHMIELQSPDMLCSILLVDTDGIHVHHAAGPSLPEEFLAAFDGFPIGPSAGSCGTAAWRREPVFVADIATDPLWENYQQYALPYGLRACWSTPIFDAQRRVLGTFAVYHRQPGLPSERHRQLISMITHTAAICISRHRAEAEREQAVAREQKARVEYTLQLIASQEAERKRIAAELHDSIGQNLLLIKNLAEMSLRTQEPEGAYENLATINHLALQCIAEARQISRDLRPYQLDHLGLRRALEAMVEHADQASAIQFNSRFEPVDELFSADAAMNLYRIVQESLNNILKHAHASRVNIHLERDIHEVQLKIEDDGAGFSPDKIGAKKGLGLKNIAERVRMLGGTLKITSSPGTGTRVDVTIPIAEKPA